MINIVGGTYIEHCMEPRWDRLLGSGLRAALALSRANDDQHAEVHLTTVIGSQQLPDLRELATVYKFKFDAHPAERTIRFSYAHCLSDPRISPRPDTIIKRQLSVSGEIVLCYGMLDADATVTGGTVVYDPQGPQAPVPFRSGKGSADRLAIVANAAEAKRLANEVNLEHAANTLLLRERADVVVVKAGLRGAIVAYKDLVVRVPAYESSFSWTLGSGDLFAAAFTEFWARQGLEPVKAADLASRAVALYAERRAIPPLNRDELWSSVTRRFEAIDIDTESIYLAGPFFTLPQRWLIEESRRELQRIGLRVRSPLHDVGVGSADEVADLDLQMLNECDRVFAIIDGLDAGTLFEVGYARRQGIPVIALAQNVSKEDLKMIEGSRCEVIDDFATAIAASLRCK